MGRFRRDRSLRSVEGPRGLCIRSRQGREPEHRGSCPRAAQRQRPGGMRGGRVRARPRRPARGNGCLLYEVNNRGNKGIVGFFNQGGGGNDVSSAGDGFLMRRGFTIVWSGWDGELLAGGERMQLRAPVARPGATDGGATTITGRVRCEFVPATRHAIASPSPRGPTMAAIVPRARTSRGPPSRFGRVRKRRASRFLATSGFRIWRTTTPTIRHNYRRSRSSRGFRGSGIDLRVHLRSPRSAGDGVFVHDGAGSDLRSARGNGTRQSLPGLR